MFVANEAPFAYPIIGQVVSFLERDTITLGTDAHLEAVADNDEETKRRVQSWYDTFGWRKTDGVYNDTAMFSAVDGSGFELYEGLSHLSLLERLPGGEFLLDAASGAIARPEYLAFGWRYRFRVCVDLSRTALEEAAAKVQASGFCCLADLTALPFVDGSMNAVVSGYTVQHIPAAQHAQAFSELYRVLQPGGHLCVMTDVVRRPTAQSRIMLGFRILRKLAKIAGLTAPYRPAHSQPTSPEQPHPLYFYPRDIDWWRERATAMGGQVAIETLRSLTRSDFERVFGLSRRAAKFVRLVETALPRLLAPGSPYCLIDVVKPANAPERLDSTRA